MEPIMDSYVEFWKDKVDQVSYNDMLDNVTKDVIPISSPWIWPFPYQRLEVYWDGTVTVCYNDIYGELSVGNASSRSLKDCWQTGLAELREKHSTGRVHEIPTCAACPLRAYEMKKLGES